MICRPGCHSGRGLSLRACRFGVSGLAVVMTFPNGFARTLTFEDGEFVRSNPAMSGVGTDMACQLSDGMHFVRVYDQRSELPKALVFGK